MAAALSSWTVNTVEGGERRQDSVRAALEETPTAEIVCVHDGARPLCPARVVREVIDAARRHGAATAAVPLVDSVKRIDADGVVMATLDRAELVAVQTPQAFQLAVLREAHVRAVADRVTADDDCALVERLGHRVVTVPGDPANVKVTRAEDLALLGILAS
jgi:2-C-methyl-D-erythritol 4-phosphate cytidylyltransferase